MCAMRSAEKPYSTGFFHPFWDDARGSVMGFPICGKGLCRDDKQEANALYLNEAVLHRP